MLLLFAIPSGLLVMWWVSTSASPDSAAEIEVVTDNVAALRGTVIARMTAVGGVRVGEDTSYSGQGASTLEFRVPANRLEDALTELGDVGGQVTSQRINMDTASDSADQLKRELSGLDACLEDLSRVVARGDAGAVAADLGSCQRRLDTLTSSVTDAGAEISDVAVRVRISPASSTNLLLILAIAIMAVALATMMVLTLRTIREERTIDLSDDEPAGDPMFDRHWN